MARSPVPLTQFSAGLLSDRLLGRVDLRRYYAGARDLTNVILQPQGGAFKRPGTEYINHEPSGTREDGTYNNQPIGDHVLVPFEYSRDDAYVLEISGRFGVRFYRDGSLITASSCPSTGLLNGGMDAGTNWTDVSTGAGASATVSGQKMTLTRSNAGYGAMYQQITGVSGSQSYVLTLAVENPAISNARSLGSAYTVELPTGGNRHPYLRLQVGSTGSGSTENLDINLLPGTHAVPFSLNPSQTTIDITLKYDSGNDVQSSSINVLYCQFAGATLDGVRASNGVYPVELLRVQSGLSLFSYDNDDLLSSQFAQSADTLYWALKGHPLRQFQRFAEKQWSLIEPPLGGPFLDQNIISAYTLTTTSIGTTGHFYTFTFSGTTYLNGGAGLSSRDLGRPIATIHNSGAIVNVWIIMEITSTTVCKCQAITDLHDYTTYYSGADPNWALGVWQASTGATDTDENMGPTAIAFHQQRMLLGGYRKQPQTLFASEIGIFEGFRAAGTLDERGWTYQIGSGSFNSIVWIRGLTDLIIGTTAQEFRAVAGSSDDIITITNPPQIVPQTSYGSAPVAPLQISSSVLFVTRTGRKVREVSYVFDRDSYEAPDITVLSEHLTRTYEGEMAEGRIRQLAYMREPIPMIFAVTDDGRLLCLTYEREQEVVGWAEWRPAPFASDETAAFRSVCVVPSQYRGAYDVYVAIRRTGVSDFANLSTIYVERLKFRGGLDYAINNQHEWFVESGVEYTGGGGLTDTITGLDHLNGFQCAVLADGDVHPPVTPSGGSVTLDYKVTRAIIGLGYTPRIETMPINPQDVAATHNVKALGRIGVMLYRTLAARIQGDVMPDRDVEESGGYPGASANPMDRFTGLVFLSDDNGYSESQTIVIDQEDNTPLPLNVLGIFANSEVGPE